MNNNINGAKNMLSKVLVEVYGDKEGFHNDDVLTTLMIMFYERYSTEEQRNLIYSHFDEDLAKSLIDYYTCYYGGVKVE